MKATIKQIKGCSFVGKADSNHWVTIDTPKETCGLDAAASPMELVLIALGSCTAADVISILEKKRMQIKGLEVNVDAEQADSYPRVFKKIKLEYVFYGREIKPEQIEKAVSLSQKKYCSVYAMLKNSVAFKTSCKIVKM